MSCPTARRMPRPAMLPLIIAMMVMSSAGDDVTDGTELVLAFVVHRHGDRTPVESSVAYSTDPDELELRSARYGYGQLTDEGKRTGYRVGQYLRQRYGGLLSAHYNRSELYVRCTDSTRTKMTALTSLAALYPPSASLRDNWNEQLAWQPVPYTTVPVKYDSNMAMLNCPTFIAYYYSAFMSSADEMSQYSDLIERWCDLGGINITGTPVLAYAVYDVYTSQMSLGIPLADELTELLPEIKQAAGAAIRVLFGNEDYLYLQSGVLLKEFLEVSSEAVSGSDTQPVRVLSAHDYNVYSFMSATRVQPTTVPQYGAVFSLELRRRTDTGAYVVLPVYKESPTDESVQYMQISGCSELLCDLDEFTDLTADYVMEESAWRTACGFTDDLEIDDSSVA